MNESPSEEAFLYNVKRSTDIPQHMSVLASNQPDQRRDTNDLPDTPDDLKYPARMQGLANQGGLSILIQHVLGDSFSGALQEPFCFLNMCPPRIASNWRTQQLKI